MGKATHGLGEGSEEAIRYLGRGWLGRKWVGKGVRRGCSRPGGGGMTHPAGTRQASR